MRGRLERIDVPGEHDARVRAWTVVEAAFAGREPVPRRRRALGPALVAAALVALLAGALSPPGRAVIDSVRAAVGVERAAPALFRLPAAGRLLVDAGGSTWIVRPDGSKRRLAGRRDASWSPFGRFLVAARANELAALEPDGDVRWTLARPRVRLPRWGGSRTDTRIAYLSGPQLRVVAGDGTGDRLLAPRARAVAPAWRPGAAHVLAFADGGGRVVVADATRGVRMWARRAGDVRRLEWSRDGRLLLVQSARSLRIYGPDGSLRYDLLGEEAAPVEVAALAPSGRSVAFVQRADGRSTLWVIPRLAPDASAARRVLSGQGAFTGLAWSPDGRWLLVAWRDADQWVFVDSTRVRRLEAVSGIARQFGGSFPLVGGWCCREAAKPAPAAAAPAAAAPPPPPPPPARSLAAAGKAAVRAPTAPQIRWRRSVALGGPSSGRLVRGVLLPAEGETYFTWDPVLRRAPNREWRRVGSDRLVRVLLRTLDAFRAAHPRAPRVGIGDLSRPNGGDFGARFGGLGHVSHQNGLDADVYFPRRDRRERPPRTAAQVDRVLAQDLVDRFVRAGAVRVFVGPNVRLRGNPAVVQILPHHDNHLHVRIR